jgi:hypothetical protein
VRAQSLSLLDGVFRTALSLMLDAHPQRLIRNIGLCHLNLHVLISSCGL